ncbi:helicase HerA domain-containing protein, partial [Campylobacter coli]
AFKGNGAIYDVSNLQMPYWLMNFEEHCEVFVTASGAERQIDADILAKCLLGARAKGRLGQEISKLTVDAPVPYLLSDLSNLIQLEMGKLDRA